MLVIVSLSLTQEPQLIPDSRAPHHQMSVVISQALRDPQFARVCRTREIPGAKLDRSQTFYIPDMKKLVRHRAQSVFVNA